MSMKNYIPLTIMGLSACRQDTALHNVTPPVPEDTDYEGQNNNPSFTPGAAFDVCVGLGPDACPIDLNPETADADFPFEDRCEANFDQVTAAFKDALLEEIGYADAVKALETGELNELTVFGQVQKDQWNYNGWIYTLMLVAEDARGLFESVWLYPTSYLAGASFGTVVCSFEEDDAKVIDVRNPWVAPYSELDTNGFVHPALELAIVDQTQEEIPALEVYEVSYSPDDPNLSFVSTESGIDINSTRIKDKVLALTGGYPDTETGSIAARGFVYFKDGEIVE